MKILLAVLQTEDAKKIIGKLNKEGYKVTKMNSTGGFLNAGNVTLLLGVPAENVEHVIDIIKADSRTRTKSVSTAAMPYVVSSASIGIDGMIPFNIDSGSLSVDVKVGGATIFVLENVNLAALGISDAV